MCFQQGFDYMNIIDKYYCVWGYCNMFDDSYYLLNILYNLESNTVYSRRYK